MLTLALTAICTCPTRRALTSKSTWVIHTGSTILTGFVYACYTFVDICEKNKFNCINVESNVEYFELIFQVLHSAYTVNGSFFLADVYSGCRFQLFEFRVENSHTWNNVVRRCVVSEGIRNKRIVTSEKII